MVRAILLGLLAISAVGACKGGGDSAPAVEPGKTVGKVVELKGTVRATRSGTTRQLAAGAEVSGDDVIETGADGRVTIVLAHNNATWDLGPNKQEQVSGSMAWKLAKASGPAGSVDETTTAAGRHAERHAATGGESAGAPANTERESDDQAAPSAAAPPAEPAKPDRGPAAVTTPTTPTTPTAPTAPPPVTAPSTGRAPGGGALPPPSDTRRTQEKATATAKGGPRPGGGTVRTNDDSLDALLGEGGGGGAKQKAGAPGGGGEAPDAAAVRAALSAQMSALRACVTASGKDKLTIKLKVVAGKTTITLPDGTDADRACFAAVATRIKLTGTTAQDVSVSIPKGG